MRNQFARTILVAATAVAVLTSSVLGQTAASSKTTKQAGKSPVMLAGITKDWQKLEGRDNQGIATLELDGAKARIAGAVATPFAIGDAQASVSGQVRVLLPERGTSPDFSSAMLALYGKDRSQRLMAFIAFKVLDL